jgi:hypothetical protein
MQPATTDDDLLKLTNQYRRLRMACEADVAQPAAYWNALGREIFATFLRGQSILVEVHATDRDAVAAFRLVLEQLSNLRLIANARLWQARNAGVVSPELVRGQP